MQYDELMRHTPYDFAKDYPWVAAAMAPGPDGIYGSAANPLAYFDDIWEETGPWGSGMWLKFKVRSGIKFHGDADGVGGLDDLTPEDVRFTLLFTRDCGPGVAWSYPSVADVAQVDTQAQDPSLNADEVKVYINVKTYWAHYWIMYFYVLNKKLWSAANTAFGWGYDMVNDQPGVGWDPLGVKAYKPETDDGNANGIPDLAEDGAGPWVFKSWTKGDTMLLEAFKGGTYYKTQEEITSYLAASFHRSGNVNYEGAKFQASYPLIDWEVSVVDGMYVARGFNTQKSPPWPVNYPDGIDWNQFNLDADFDVNLWIFGYDLWVYGTYYKRDAG
jgi:hypothetical protein